MTIPETVALLFILLIAASVVMSTLQVGISPMPSSFKARRAMLRCCENTGTGPIYELGSGWGNLLIPLARTYPHRQIVGYELSLFPWLTSICLIKLLRLRNVQLYRKDFFKADISNAAVICCYLYPKGMTKLEGKLNAAAEKPHYLISNTFALPSGQPQKTIRLDDFYRSPVYLYALKAHYA